MNIIITRCGCNQHHTMQQTYTENCYTITTNISSIHESRSINLFIVFKLEGNNK